MSLLHRIDNHAHTFFIVMVAAALISWALGAYEWFKRRHAHDSKEAAGYSKKRFISFAVFAAIVGIMSLYNQWIVGVARSEAVAALRGNILSVEVNGKAVNYSDLLIADLRNMDTSPTRYHHSHPDRPAYLVLLHTDKGDVRLRLDSDSDILKEYWVYYPDYQTTSYNDVGFVRTSAFEDQ